ncbi:MAG TPA: hypothetical protein PLN69_01400 [bacterium]|nr:hypothetical protein [bacterium]
MAAVFASTEFDEDEYFEGIADMFSDEVCSNVCFERMEGGLFTCHQECERPGQKRLPAGVDFLIKNVRDNLAPPMLKKVEINVSGGEPVALDIVMEPYSYSLSELTDIAIKFVYSVNDPVEWVPVGASLNPVEEKWEASVELPGEAERVYSTVRMGDLDGNTYIEIPCDIEGPFNESKKCIFPMSGDESYAEDENLNLNPSLDILDSEFARDAKRYYFRVKMGGNVDAGEKVPQNANYYLIGLYDPGRPPGVDPYHKTYFVMFAPYLFDHDGCRIIAKRGEKWSNDSNGVRCDAEGDVLTVSVLKKVLPEPVSGIFVTFVATGVVFDENTGIIADYTSTTAIRLEREPLEINR